MNVGIPRELVTGERRVAATPDTVHRLLKQGFSVRVARGAGAAANIPDAAYERAGASVVDQAEAWNSAVVLKIHPPMVLPEGGHELDGLAEGALLVSFAYPAQNPDLLDRIVARKASLVALESIPRTTVAQKMDVLSSMANVAGYRAVIEAAQVYGSLFAGQITAAGSTKPAKVLVIGAGVAGLAAIGAARGLGAEVRAFDTRPATRLEVESLGGKFLEVQIAEEGDGGGGYAKVMSPAFIAAEMALFRKQAAEVDIIITTALIPGKKAPILLPEDVCAALKPGSVVVDMAAAQGGNCVHTVAGQATLREGVTYLGYTDLTSRLPVHSSQLFGANRAHLLKHLGGAEKFGIPLGDENIRSAVLVHQGELLPTVAPPSPKAPPAPAPAAQAATAQATAPGHRREVGTGIAGLAGLVSLATLGLYAPAEFLQHLTVFVLACFVGWQVIWNVSPALHTPLMSVTNAISGIIILGGMLQLGSDSLSPAAVLGALAVLLASINISGGFLVTQRMLRMFHRGDEHA